MNPFEYPIYILTLLLLISILLAGNQKRRNINLLILLCIMILLNLFIGNFRWQMIPLLLLILTTALTGLILYYREKKNKKCGWLLKFILVTLLSLWWIAALLPPTFFPIDNLPKPSGSYSVGTKSILFIDSSRTDPFNSESSEFRKIPAKLFYPSDIVANAEPEAYFQNAYELSKNWAEANGFGLFPFIWSHLGLVNTNSFLNSDISDHDSLYPVLIFSHGYGQFSKFNTILLEELASHGFIVLSITHEYETCIAQYPEEKIITYSRNLPFFARRQIETENDSSSYYLHHLHQTNNPLEQKNLYEKFYANMSTWIESNDIWVKDIRFCIDQLQNIGTMYLSDKIDTSKVGVLGYSFGGGASGTAALIEKRIKACVNIDGFQYGHLLEENFTCPVMFIQSERIAGSNDYFTPRAENDVFDLIIKGMNHTNFTDNAFLAEIPGKIIGHLGGINAKYGLSLTKDIISNFFKKYLQNKENISILEIISSYPEIDDAVPQ